MLPGDPDVAGLGTTLRAAKEERTLKKRENILFNFSKRIIRGLNWGL